MRSSLRRGNISLHWTVSQLGWLPSGELVRCPMSHSLHIRPAIEADSEAIASLIQSVAHYFLSDSTGKGPEAFLSSISQPAVLGYITNPNFRYIAGFIGDELVAVAALRDNKHIYHLFVSPAHHKHSFAAALWRHLKTQAIESGNTEGFTVNSSLYAAPVYHRWGFIPTADLQSKNGIAFQPMHLPMSDRGHR